MNGSLRRINATATHWLHWAICSIRRTSSLWMCLVETMRKCSELRRQDLVAFSLEEKDIITKRNSLSEEQVIVCFLVLLCVFCSETQQSRKSLKGAGYSAGCSRRKQACC
jgi:hypothetical protein